ncbi:MAG: glycosyltransferase [Lachnospiraceae bacterium]|nr:glycosyltransferase [Lachnospiraceae bacterium]
MSESRKHSFRLSIIVPCYKVEKYLRRCLDALLSQTLEGIELVCINDGSPDGCLEILREYRSRHGESFVLIDKKTRGYGKPERTG